MLVVVTAMVGSIAGCVSFAIAVFFITKRWKKKKKRKARKKRKNKKRYILSKIHYQSIYPPEIHPSICLTIHPPTCQPILLLNHLSITPSTQLAFNQLINPFIILFINSSIYIFIYLSFHPFIYLILFIYISILFIHSSFYLSIHPSFYLSIHPSIQASTIVTWIFFYSAEKKVTSESEETSDSEETDEEEHFYWEIPHT